MQGDGSIFQFHKGAIRTRKQTDRGKHPSYFNSIKVRLELKAHFGVTPSDKFQFHKGAIRTLRMMPRSKRSLISIP